jgi:hypothetical protein
MMGDRLVMQESLFYEFCLDEFVPSTHMLRAIDRGMPVISGHGENTPPRPNRLAGAGGFEPPHGGSRFGRSRRCGPPGADPSGGATASAVRAIGSHGRHHRTCAAKQTRRRTENFSAVAGCRRRLNFLAKKAPTPDNCAQVCADMCGLSRERC